MRQAIILVLVVLSLIGVVLMYKACQFVNSFAGSHPNAEYYRINKSKNDVIEAINKFKAKNPEYKVITTNPEGELVESLDGYSYYTYYCSFYMQNLDLVLNCIVIGDSINPPSEIGLFAMSRDVHFRKWYAINTSDIGWWENYKIKRNFEKEVLDKLGLKWR